MADEAPSPPAGRIDSLDRLQLQARLREAARQLAPQRVMDDLEIGHLVHVITECSLLLGDVYAERRIARIMQPERDRVSRLVARLIERHRGGAGEALHRFGRLPDDVRVVGDKALFDLGLSGQRRIRGYDLEELGARAYRLAAEVLERIADDRLLRGFFEQNQLRALPLEEEVLFLRQCSEKFRLYADILQRMTRPASDGPAEPATGVAAAAAARVELFGDAERPPGVAGDGLAAYVAAARGRTTAETNVSREQLISTYERILLFSALDLDRLVEALDRTVVDQEAAVRALRDDLALFATGTRDPRKPPAFFLVGPTGVGKNHLVESLVRLLEGLWQVEIPMLVIEGPSYTYPSDINELRGATRGFIRSDEEGLLSSFHQRSSRAPLAVMLIDEVEKAHPQLMTFFLSILDRGTTTDNRGEELNFANCLLFFTSNVGYSDAQQRAAPIGYLGEDERTRLSDVDVRQEVRRALKPEFVNRLRMIHFNRLTAASAERILDLEFDRIAGRYRELHALTIELEDSARRELIRRGFSAVHGARHLAATLDAVCNVSIANRIRGDDRRSPADSAPAVDWLREMRAGRRAFQAEEVRRRMRELAGARLDYDVLRVVFADDEFRYLPRPRQEPA
jgi:MoxR-like ATPase